MPTEQPPLDGWEDCTSYQQHEPRPRTPRSWSRYAGALRLFVSRGHVHYPNAWIARVMPLMSSEREIGKVDAMTPNEAMQACEVMAGRYVKAMVDALGVR